MGVHVEFLRSFWRFAVSRDGWWFTAGSFGGNAWACLGSGSSWLAVVYFLLSFISALKANATAR